MIDDRKWRILNNNINKSVKAKIGRAKQWYIYKARIQIGQEADSFCLLF